MSENKIEEIDKYKAVERLDQVNELAKQGYRLHSIFTRSDRDGREWPIFVMSYSASKYDGITHLEDVDPEDVNDLLEHGWTILETYSKKIRMVLREGKYHGEEEEATTPTS